MIAVLAGGTGLIGLAIGSFLNVVIFRVPAGLSIVRPASACPGCGGAIRSRDNIPVLSWLLLGRRCRDCRMAISARYPAIEASTALAFVAVSLVWLPRILGAGGVAAEVAAGLELVVLLYVVAVSIALAMIDLDVHRLPNAIVGPAYLVVMPLLTASALVSGDPSRLVTIAIGAGASLLFYAILWFVYPGGMGEGDVKLAGVVGAVLGYFGFAPLIVGTMAAFVLGGMFGVALIALRRSGRKTGIPFGPWMLVGLWVGVFAGVPIADAYLSLFGLT